MRAWFRTTLHMLTSLLWYLGRPLLYCLWTCKQRWPKRFGWAWTLVHNPKWQKDSAWSVSVWLIATPIIFDLAHRMGHGFWVSLTVSLTIDGLGFIARKLWIWRHRQISLPRCGQRNMVLWAMTFSFNGATAWFVIHRIGLENARFLMTIYGFGINPVMFKARDKLVFAEINVREAAAAWVRKERAEAEVMPRFMRT